MKINKMMFLAFVTAVMTLILLEGCSTIKATFITPSGGPVADHYYVLNSTTYPLSAIFYYAAVPLEKDLDESTIPAVEYIDARKEVKLIRGDYKGLILIAYIDNPKGLTFNIHQTAHKKIGKYHEPIDIMTGGPVTKSNRTRMFFFDLPYEEELTEAYYTVIFEVDGNEAFRIGPFSYKLI